MLEHVRQVLEAQLGVALKHIVDLLDSIFRDLGRDSLARILELSGLRACVLLSLKLGHLRVHLVAQFLDLGALGVGFGFALTDLLHEFLLLLFFGCALLHQFVERALCVAQVAGLELGDLVQLLLALVALLLDEVKQLVSVHLLEHTLAST